MVGILSSPFYILLRFLSLNIRSESLVRIIRRWKHFTQLCLHRQNVPPLHRLQMTVSGSSHPMQHMSSLHEGPHNRWYRVNCLYFSNGYVNPLSSVTHPPTHPFIHPDIKLTSPLHPPPPTRTQSNIHSATQTQALSQMTNHKFAPFFTLGPEMVAVTLFRWKCMSPSTLSNEKKESIKNSDFFLFIHTRGSRQQQDK